MEMTLTDKILSFCSASIPEMPQSKEAISPMAGLEIYNILAFLSGDSQFLDSALSSLVNYASVKQFIMHESQIVTYTVMAE